MQLVAPMPASSGRQTRVRRRRPGRARLGSSAAARAHAGCRVLTRALCLHDSGVHVSRRLGAAAWPRARGRLDLRRLCQARCPVRPFGQQPRRPYRRRATRRHHRGQLARLQVPLPPAQAARRHRRRDAYCAAIEPSALQVKALSMLCVSFSGAAPAWPLFPGHGWSASTPH